LRPGTGRAPHGRQYFVIGEAPRRTGGYLNYVVAPAGFDPLRQVWIVTTGMEGDAVPATCKGTGQVS